MKARIIRGGAGAVLGAAVGALIGYSGLHWVWAVVGALAGAGIAGVTAMFVGAWIAEARHEAGEAGVSVPIDTSYFGG